jgi:prepilin-type N-terminal cleavage/methylation domain-containing protein
MRKSTQGFTLVEVLLSVVLLSMIAGMSVPLTRIFLERNELDQTTMALAQTYRRAQFMSIAQDGDSAWGVKVTPSGILLFKGASYATRDQLFDESTSIVPSIMLSGLSEVVFQKGTGIPTTTGTSTFTARSNEIRNVTINQKGMVNY